jgi:hypothetical protein
MIIYVFKLKLIDLDVEAMFAKTATVYLSLKVALHIFALMIQLTSYVNTLAILAAFVC